MSKFEKYLEILSEDEVSKEEQDFRNKAGKWADMIGSDLTKRNYADAVEAWNKVVKGFDLKFQTEVRYQLGEYYGKKTLRELQKQYDSWRRKNE